MTWEAIICCKYDDSELSGSDFLPSGVDALMENITPSKDYLGNKKKFMNYKSY